MSCHDPWLASVMCAIGLAAPMQAMVSTRCRMTATLVLTTAFLRLASSCNAGLRHLVEARGVPEEDGSYPLCEQWQAAPAFDVNSAPTAACGLVQLILVQLAAGAHMNRVPVCRRKLSAKLAKVLGSLQSVHGQARP